MKKRLKHAHDIKVGDTIKIIGYVWEVSLVEQDTDGSVTLHLWLWARPAKTCVLKFNDPTFPVTVR